MEVYFENFWADVRTGSSGRKVLLEIKENWRGSQWRIPAMYLCEEGVVVDICRKIPMDRVRSFYHKWNGVDEESLSEEQVECLMEDSPFEANAAFTLEADGYLESSGSSSVVWQDIRPELSDPVTEELMKEYQCGKEYAWQFFRLLGRWKNREQTRPREVQLLFRTLPDRYRIPGHFVAGDNLLPQVEFQEPWSGLTHVLKVMECKAEQLKGIGQDEDFKYPDQYRVLRYTISPPLTGASLLVRDVKEGDRPVPLKRGMCSSTIGGAISRNDISHEDWNSVCSSIYFKEPEKIEWRLELHAARVDELSITIPVSCS